MSTITVSGSAGFAGIVGANLTALSGMAGAGGSGGTGGYALASNPGNGVDTYNKAVADGGNGGVGGAGGHGYGGASGGNGGAGGAGGNGFASVVTNSTSLYDVAQANGGYGGGGGASGGASTPGAPGADGNGGAGGNATAAATLTGVAGAVAARATATGGTGGGNGIAGGAGGTATASAYAAGSNATITVQQTGGNGAGAFNGVNGGGNGGAGAGSYLVNAARGAASGVLSLSQYALGGNGGNEGNGYGSGGAAGGAGSLLVLDDTTGAIRASTLVGQARAKAGNPGAGDLGAVLPGGNASAGVTLSGIGNVTAGSKAYGGSSAMDATGTIAGAAAGAGGAATASSVATSDSTGYASVYAQAAATGGVGGSGPGVSYNHFLGGRSGGAGGAASASARAIAASETSGIASANAIDFGGFGGAGWGTGNAGGVGYAPTAISAYAEGFNARASVQSYTGQNGPGIDGATGVAGAGITLTNAASGRANGGTLSLFQADRGGAGFYNQSNGLAYAGGAASSVLNVSDTLAAELHGTAQAEGGVGGIGGAAYVAALLTASHNVRAVANADGGSGAISRGDSGTGNAGTAVARANSTGAGNTAIAQAVVHGGSGGGVLNQTPGTGGAGAGGYVTAAARGYNAKAFASLYGGGGGVAATGGNAAGAVLNNAVSASSGGGVLGLYQTAVGGNATQLGGAGGAAVSDLSFNDVTANATHASTLVGYVEAKGGVGYTSSTADTARAMIAMVGAGNVYATAKANAYAAGYLGVAGSGAYGASTAVSTGTGTVNATATTDLQGGNGSGHSGASGGGGAGAGVSAAAAISTELAATGGLAQAVAYGRGGAGGNADGSGFTAGSGGVATATTAAATGYSAYVQARQRGGYGGEGFGGAVAGAGASSTLVNAVAAAVRGGGMTLVQRAIGGYGGNSQDGLGGAAGDAVSRLTYTASNASSLIGRAIAQGGAGGYSDTSGSSTLTGGAAGGYAGSTIALYGKHEVSATAAATGGNAGGWGRTASAAGGTAYAHAYASATGSNSLSTASAYADPVGGQGTLKGLVRAYALASTADGQRALAEAQPVGYGGAGLAGAISANRRLGGVVNSATAIAVHSKMTGAGTVDIGALAQFGAVGTPPLAMQDALASVAAQPSAASLTSELLGAPTVSAALAGDVVFGAASLAGGDVQAVAGTQGDQSIASWTIAGADLTGQVVLGLAGSQAVGSGFSTAELVVSLDGTQVLGQTFTSLAAAQSYFADTTIDLGAVAGTAGEVVAVTLDVVTTQTGEGFGGALLLGAAAGAPAITVPVAGPNNAFVGQTLALGGVGISDGAASVTLTLADTLGTLSASGAGVSGTAHDLVISGAPAQVNADLASLGYLSDVSGGDTITVSAVDSLARTATIESFAVTVACYAEGTRILTARGPVAIEALRVGEAVVTSSGGLAPVAWIGRRRMSARLHPRPGEVMPVRVHRDALADGVPARDVMLSPDHAVLAEGVLVPVRHLVNGTSITQEDVEFITYWHIELERHDIVLAEGMACETYLDTGNRAAFENAGGTVMLHPAFAPGGEASARRVWEARGCAAILTDPAAPALRRLHLRLLARARHLVEGQERAAARGR